MNKFRIPNYMRHIIQLILRLLEISSGFVSLSKPPQYNRNLSNSPLLGDSENFFSREGSGVGEFTQRLRAEGSWLKEGPFERTPRRGLKSLLCRRPSLQRCRLLFGLRGGRTKRDFCTIFLSLSLLSPSPSLVRCTGQINAKCST